VSSALFGGRVAATVDDEDAVVASVIEVGGKAGPGVARVLADPAVSAAVIALSAGVCRVCCVCCWHCV
jgi:hypothetical protein